MASFNIHLAVGKRYLQKTGLIKNEEQFYRGIVDPDLVANKKISHYSGVLDKSNLSDYLANKVLLYNYLEQNEVNSDYKIGEFLHLITDYLFFNDFFDIDYINHIDYQDFCVDLYYSYDVTNDYLENKYELDSTMFYKEINDNITKDKKEKNTINKKGNNILPENKINNFIERVSDINLDVYANSILKNKGNLLP